MREVENVLVVVVAALHVYFLLLEMVFWTKPLGLRVFRMTQTQAEQTKVLAANQGLYNGFLALGLLLALLVSDPLYAQAAKRFFFFCVAVAGAYGGYSVNKRIFIVQGVPALLGLAVSIV